MFHLLDGRDELYQWDLNIKVVVEDDSINEVHFANKACSKALVGKIHEENYIRYAIIPNVLLQAPYDLKIYGYKPDFTAYSDIFPVVSRPRPESYVYTEGEKYTVHEAVKDALQDAKNSGEFDGISCEHEWIGTVLRIKSASGVSEANLRGPKYTLTTQDRDDIAQEVLKNFPYAEEGKY